MIIIGQQCGKCFKSRLRAVVAVNGVGRSIANPSSCGRVPWGWEKLFCRVKIPNLRLPTYQQLKYKFSKTLGLAHMKKCAF